MSYGVDETEKKIFMIRVAEQAECYDEMFEMMLPLIKDKTVHLTSEERTLFSVACKNYINRDRYTYRTIKAIMLLLAYRAQRPLLEEYLLKSVVRFESICLKVIDHIEKLVIEPEKENKEPKEQESLAFFWKMKADLYRYICETAKGKTLEKAKEDAKKCYVKANSFVIPSFCSTKMSIGLNLAVFEFEVCKNITHALKISEKLLGDSLEKMD